MGTIGALQEVLNHYGVSGALLVAVVVGVLSLAIYVNFFHIDSDFKRAKPDPNLPPPSEIVSLRIYPVKSCRGIVVDECKLLQTGLDLDRNWMFVDAMTKKFMTIRQVSEMTLINTAIDWTTNELTLSIANTDISTTISSRPSKEWLEANTSTVQVEIWEEWTDAWAYGKEINDQFATHFGKPVILVYKGPTIRSSRTNGAPHLYGSVEPVNFPDVLPLQIASEASIADVKAHMIERGKVEDAEAVTIERYRPNIIIKGNKPWEEDSWKAVQIVTVDYVNEMLWRMPLDVVARCGRCTVPNVNPDTAARSKQEPWDTTYKYRRIDEGLKLKPFFGMLAIPKKAGPIKVGSKLEVLATTDKHHYGVTAFKDL